jgi:hypothetical protein
MHCKKVTPTPGGKRGKSEKQKGSEESKKGKERENKRRKERRNERTVRSGGCDKGRL